MSAPHILANPTRFLSLSTQFEPWLKAVAFALLAVGLYLALITSPADYQQGEAVRIMYVHVPAAVMAMGVYVFMGLNSAIFLIWRHNLANIIAQASAPLGAGFTLLCILTGMLWGKPMWGAWWVWDARLTSVVVLLFLYIGYMALADADRHSERTAKACATLALLGLANIPVIHFSVEWWNTLHQPATLLRAGGPAIYDAGMFAALLIMGLAFAALFVWMLVLRTRTALLHMKIRRLRRF